MSDPKMYRREALIEERRKDVEWIDKLIEKSETVDFKPEILREVETITAISAALGLKYDPGAAVSYQRSSETGEIRQQIDTMKLQLQLDQLKRDAELVRAKYASQTEPVNENLGKLASDDSPATASAGVSAADQLKAAIDRLTVATYDFNKQAKGAAVAGTSNSPADDFRDRQAYRDMLKAARNAASLDELHDLRGSALLRLNFQATVIPDEKSSSAPGVIQMRVIGPRPGSALKNRFYRGWLDDINRRANVKVNGKWQPNADLLQGAVTDNFQTVYYLYAPKLGAAGTANCHGFVKAEKLSNYTACSNLVFEAPQLSNSVLGGNAYMSFTKDIHLMLHDIDANERQNDLANRQRIVSVGSELVKDCRYIDAPTSVIGPDGKPQTPDSYKLQQALRNARVRLAVGDTYIGLERTARDILKVDDINPAVDPALASVRERTAQAGLLTDTFLNTVMAGCTFEERKSFEREDPEIYLSPRAREVLWGDEARVAIYEIGPREQAQQMSTVARSANSLGLALSMAASSPGSGAAAEAAGSYSRQAMGRAEALERLPTVVGYSVGSLQTFGWVLGPKATVNPKGKINLEQGLRSYDLTVDLSVPGWWPDFELETLTAWAPKRAELVEGDIRTLAIKGADGQRATIASRKIRVPMLPTDADYGGFTSLLASTGFDQRRQAALQIDDAFRLQKVSACRATTIVLKGPFLWRATTVIVGGVKLNGSSIAVLPDMSGIMVDVPPLDGKVAEDGATVSVSILTPYGASGTDVTYEASPGDGCKKEEKKPDPNAPSVTDYNPKAFQLPGVITIHATGKNLDKVTRITFGDIKGTITAQASDSIDLKFPQDETSVLSPSMAVILSLYYMDANKKEQRVDKTAAITANNGGK